MIFAPLILALCASSAPERADLPVILDFTAPWCGPCQQMKPAVEQLERSGYPVRPVDYDTSPLVKKYGIDAVPTFVVVDAEGRELDRIKGYRPAKDIAAMYRRAQARMEEAPTPADEVEQADEPAAAKKNPLPWETVVRIRIDNHLSRPPSLEFGSGTIIRSTPEETIILTCAHIFKINGARKQFPPSQFPLKITVELSDGQLRKVPMRGASPSSKAVMSQVHMVEAHEGKAIDYSFEGDVGLIRIRPGRRLPATPVVPAEWVAEARTRMTTVGCSSGNDATAWSTWITNPLVRGVDGSPNYEAIECAYAPKQGRSGGGLFTLDGKLAGVCDFAEPVGKHGLYATPRTIHRFLDRNDLTICYAPDAARERGGAMLASGRTPKRAVRGEVADTLRAQSPDAKRLSIPGPDALGIEPVASEEDAAERTPVARRDERRKPTWTNGSSAEGGAEARVRLASEDFERSPRPEPAEMTLPNGMGRDPLEGLDEPREAPLPQAPPAKPRGGSAWRAAAKGSNSPR